MRQMDQVGIVGIAEVDLFIPDANLSFVFGEADRNSKSALLSLARLRPEFSGAPQNNDLLRARARVELTHEVGHLVGLLHCQVSRCVMFFSTGVADTDRKGGAFCPDCQAELRRLGILKPANGASSP
jgi:archaemetzincin